MSNCVVMFSGGKDSVCLTADLVDAGRSPQLITVDTGYLSRACWRNLRHAHIVWPNLEHLIVRPDRRRFDIIYQAYSGFCICIYCHLLIEEIVFEHSAGLPVYSGVTPDILEMLKVSREYFLEHIAYKCPFIEGKYSPWAAMWKAWRLGFVVNPLRTNCKKLWRVGFCHYWPTLKEYFRI